MKKLLLALALLGLGAPAFAGSSPTCGDTHPTALDVVVGVTDVTATWSSSSLSCTPTKYSIEFEAQYGPAPAVAVCDGTTKTVTYTSTTSPFSIPLADLLVDLAPPAGKCWCADTAVKVKALTTAPHGPNKSQNNVFSDPDTIDIGDDACTPVPV
jgi:hypothetical protein